MPAGPVAWDDLFLGRVELDPSRLGGDFLVGRNGLGPSYQLAVVVDDALMGVNQVIRGDDLVPSTPRQILLYQALGWTPPRFGHVPLAVTPDGRRLAKRDGSIKLATLREQGVDPQAARRHRWSSRAAGRKRVVPSWPADWIARFDPRSLSREPWVAQPGMARLAWRLAVQNRLTRYGFGSRKGVVAAEHLGNELAGGGGHREAEHVVAGGDDDVVQGRAAVDDRQAVPGHRPPAVPCLLDRLALGLAQVGRRAVAEELEPVGVDGGVVAGELHRRAEPVARLERRDGDAGFGEDQRGSLGQIEGRGMVRL